MFNSITVNILAKIWSKFDYYYKLSFLNRIFTKIIRIFSSLSKESRFINLFTDDRSFIKDSFLYNMYGKILYLINKVFKFFRDIFNKYKDGSLIYILIYNSNKSKYETIKSVFISIFVFSVATIIVNIINKNIINNINMLLLILMTISLLFININLQKISMNSFTVKIIKDFFKVDNGDDKWW